MRLRDWALLLLLSAMWGASFLVIRVVVPVLGPFLLSELRVIIASAALLAFAAAAQKSLAARAHWKHFAILGAINTALPFVLIPLALKTITASLGVTLNAMTPVFGAVVAAIWLREPFTLRKGMGLLLGVAGVAAIVGLGPIPLSFTLVLAIGASLAGALCYAIGANYARVHLSQSSPLAITTYSQMATAAYLLPVVPFAPAEAALTFPIILGVVILGLFMTAFANVLYFSLIASAGPTNATLVTYLMPAFGVLWGVLFLHEPLTWGMAAGFAMVLAGVALVTGAFNFRATLKSKVHPTPPKGRS